jgi:hypothetical protein
VAQLTAKDTTNLGFLTLMREANGYMGGYLVTNQFGRPLEFRLSSAVQPNRVQQILYGETLEPYICADLIGKTMVEKTSTPSSCILTDHTAALDLRRSLEVPVACLRAKDEPDAPVRCHPGFPDDAVFFRDLLERLNGVLDLAEPFGRIREAIGEARKLGAGTRV